MRFNRCDICDMHMNMMYEFDGPKKAENDEVNDVNIILN